MGSAGGPNLLQFQGAWLRLALQVGPTLEMQSVKVCRLVPRLWLRVQTLSTNADRIDPGEATKPFGAIPSPSPLPLLGNMREANFNRHRFNLYLDECFKKYGEIFKLKFLGSSTVGP